MTAPPAALRALDEAKAGYEAEGYAVSVAERLPPPFEDFVADAVARRHGELVVVEVRPWDMRDDTRNRLARLAEMLGEKQGWRVDVVTYEPEVPPRVADPADIVRRVAEARQVADSSPDAAVMLLWSAIEGGLVRAGQKRGLNSGRAVPPRTLIRQLTIDGLLSGNQAAELDAFARLRHATAHGMCAGRPEPETRDWLARFALAAVEGEIASPDEMIDWFKARYATPEAASLRLDEDEGAYVWAGTGREEAVAVLSERFDTALEADIAETVDLLRQEASEWVNMGRPSGE